MPQFHLGKIVGAYMTTTFKKWLPLMKVPGTLACTYANELLLLLYCLLLQEEYHGTVDKMTNRANELADNKCLARSSDTLFL